MLSALALAGAGHLPRRLALAAAAAALVATLAGPAAYALSTAATPHTGAIPTAGPASTGTRGGPGGGGPGGMPAGAPGQMQGFAPGGQTGTAGPRMGNAGGMGGLLNSTTPSSKLTALLQTDADAYTWTAATVGANNASGYQLASEQPVMAIGGFNGSDPSPTLAQFKQYVADGQVHWFIASGTGGGPGGGSNEISQWVEANFTATTVDGTTLYDLSDGIQ